MLALPNLRHLRIKLFLRASNRFQYRHRLTTQPTLVTLTSLTRRPSARSRFRAHIWPVLIRWYVAPSACPPKRSGAGIDASRTFPTCRQNQGLLLRAAPLIINTTRLHMKSMLEALYTLYSRPPPPSLRDIRPHFAKHPIGAQRSRKCAIRG